MAGLTMIVTPGKAGEALKAHLLRTEIERPWTLGLPAVFAERLTDLMGVVLLVTLGLSVLPVGRDVALLGIVISVVLILAFSQPALLRGLMRLLGRVPGMGERTERLMEIYLNVQRLLTLCLLLMALFISWFPGLRNVWCYFSP